MKLILTLFLLFIITYTATAQHMRESDHIYWAALHEYTLSIDTFYSKYADSPKDKHIYLQKPDYVDSIPRQVNGYSIVLITPENQYSLYKAHHNRLLHTIMFPVAVSDSTCQITITPYRGELHKHRHYNLGVSDGTTVHFKYDCAQRRFIVDKVENWGI